MNALLVVFAACLAAASAGLHGAVLQGPGSHAAVIGPDGSHISAVEHGGAVVADVAHGYAAHTHAVPLAHHAYAHAVPVAHHAYAHAGYALHHEGQYVPSGLELLHDDGSYRAEHHLAGHYLHHY